MVILVSLAASFSPLSSNIYFLALDLIADALQIDNSAFVTSVSIYMYVSQLQPFLSCQTSAAERLPRVAQGLAPSFWGPLADVFGRRQILIYTMLLYVVACVGIALAGNFPVLMLFRFLQAAGSSSTISIGKWLSTPIFSLRWVDPLTMSWTGRSWRHRRHCIPCWERWIHWNVRWRFVSLHIPTPRYCDLFSWSNNLVRQFAMAVGPVLGGIIGDVLGFRAIFWFLVIFGGLVTTVLLLFLPETLRSIAGNGSIALTGIRHQPLSEKIWPTKDESGQSHEYASQSGSPQCREPCKKVTWRLFLDPFLFLLEKDVACTLYFGAVIYTVWSMMTTSTSFLLIKYFGLSTLQIGLCFIPNGVGCVIGSVIAGQKLDSDFKAAEDSYRYQWDLPHNHTLPKKDLPRNFPLEHARLAQLANMIYIFIFAILVYGFSLRPQATLALPLIAQFVAGYSSTAVLNLNNTLTVDLYPGKGASATAVNNLARCLLGAVGVSLTNIALMKTKPHFLFLILSCVVILSVPTVILEWKFGMKWRTQRMDRLERPAEQNAV